MATAQDWLRVTSPPPQHGNGNNTGAFGAAYTERSRTTPGAMFGQQQKSQHQPSPSYRQQQQQPRRHRQRGAPGLATHSRSSDELLQGKTNVALSPVTGPGATSFSSVASAFDFQHHVGSDPASELLVLKHILTRECLLSRLEAVCDQLRKRFQLPSATTTTADSTAARLREENGDCCGVVNLLSRMRDATVAVIEAISVWRKDMAGDPPPAFVWHGDNYLLKVTNDLNFLAGVQPLVDTLKMHPARFCRNPLMLPQTLDEQRRDGELYESGANNVSPEAGKRRHLYQVAQVLLDEESLESERDFLRQESSRSASTMPTRGETTPELRGRYGLTPGGAGYGVVSCATTSGVRRGGPQAIDGRIFSYLPSSFACERDPAEDDEGLRRQQRLSTWYEEARSQLVSLSSSPADEEYFLSSRRFWSKEELGDTGGGSSSPPPHRRPPGTLTRGSKRLAFTAAAAAAASASGRGGADGSRRSMTERQQSDGGSDDRVDLFGTRLPNRQQQQQREFPPARQTRRLQGGFRTDGQAERTAAGGGGKAPPQSQGDDFEIEGGADVWSRPDQFGGGNSAALSCLTVDDIEQILRAVDPLPATVAVCAAVVFLLTQEDQPPVDFLWPQGFEAVALPAEDFLWRLHETSGHTASSTKAQFLAPVLQREYLLPEVIERDGEHAVACLCAWALEELHVCEEFADWSERALEPWYQTQLIPAHTDVPESNEVAGLEVRLVYKALHKFPNVGGSFVISLFESTGAEEGGLIVRAFDRAKRDAFWLSLSKNKVASLGGNAGQSPATLAGALSRRLKVKSDAATGTKRLVLPPVKKLEPSSEKKKRGHHVSKRGETNSVSDVPEREGDAAAGEEAGRPTMRESDDVEASSSPPSAEGEPTAAAPDCPVQTKAQPRRSHPPPMRGSKSDDLGPLFENEGDGSDCSATGDFGGTRSAPSSSDLKRSSAASTGAGVPEENTVKGLPPDNTEQKGTAASEVAIEHQEEPAMQTTNAVELGLAPSAASTNPRAETNNSDGGEGQGPQRELGEAGVEEDGSYFDDFTPDNNDDGKRSGNQEGVEESGSYADDFADDDEEHYDEGDHEEEDGGENQTASEGEPSADAEALATGVGAAAPDGSGRSTAESAEEPVAMAINAAIDSECVTALPGRTDTDVGVHEMAAPELDGARLEGAHCSSGAPPERLDSPRESQAASADDEPRDGGDKPQQSVEEDENTGLHSGTESPAAKEREIQEDYEKDYAEGDDDQKESAKAEVVEPIQPPGVSSKVEESGSSLSANFTGVESEGESATQTTRQSESRDEVLGDVEGNVVGEETGLAHHNTQPGKNDRRSREAANSLTVPDETITGESEGGFGVSNAELVAEVTGHEVVDNPQPDLVAEADEHRDHTSPVEPASTPTAVDPSKIIDNVSAVDEGYGSEYDEPPNEDFHDDFETSDVDKASPAAAPEVEAATVAADTDSVFELDSERSEVVSEIGAQSVSMSSTAVGVADGIGEEGITTTEPEKTTAVEETPSPVEGRRSSEGGAPPTSVAQEDGFEESYEDDIGEIDTVTSAGGGGGESSCQAPATGTIAPASEPGSSCEGMPRSASLPGQEFQEEEGVSTGGDPDGEQTEADGAVADEGLAYGLAKCGSSTEDADFEADFDEEFEEDDVEEGVAQPNEEDKATDLVVGTGQNSTTTCGEETGPIQQDDAEGGVVSSGLEASNPPASTAAAVAAAAVTTTGGAGELGRGDGDEVGRQHRESSLVEEACEIPPPTEEEEGRRESQAPRKSVDHTAAAPAVAAEVEPPDEFGDDFEDDFDEEDDTKAP